MVSRKSLYLLVILLACAGIGMTVYNHAVMGVPLTPGEKRQIWSIEAKMEFTATGDPVIASMAVAGTQKGFTLLSRTAASPGYGLAFIEKDGAERAEWSIRSATGRQRLYYQIDMLVDPSARPV
jgi:hypothetical protein